MELSVRLLLLWCTAPVLISSGEGSAAAIRVGSFNPDVFGKTKFSKDHIMTTFSQIILEYDLMLLMEIRDSSETIIHSFMEILNDAAPEGVVYDIALSERLGRNVYKEQYAFIYRVDRLEVLDVYQFADEGDVFEREPFGVLLSTLNNPDVPPFFVLGLRTHPNSVLSELNSMDEVFDEAAQHFGTGRGLIMGDLRADCEGLSRAEYKTLDLVKSDRFVWAVDSSFDTTTTDGSCAYDRIIVSSELSKNVLPSKVRVMRFDTEYGFSYRETVDISNHYPIGLELEGEESVLEQLQLLQERLKHESASSLDTGVLRLAAFNVQIFGTSKYRNTGVVEVLSQIVRRYDIILIQEIRDISETVIYDFLDRVNRDGAAVGVVYAMEVSARLGRTNSKEQYAYMYRTVSVEVTMPIVYNDTDDVFEREPYSVLVRSKLLDIPKFFLLGIHVSPRDVMSELNQMDEIFALATELYGTQNGIIMGDLNAGCSYLSRSRYEELDLVTDPRFVWLIDGSVDTTTRASDCAYDRLIITGAIGNSLVPGSAIPFRYDLSYQLDQELTEDVSDHYPVEMQIQDTYNISGSGVVVRATRAIATATTEAAR